ncbi:MAG: nitrate/nitrite transporter [uncultured archaeon A07HR60]|nr:MAG: nitrate/nitrite transporter [uncultured archaeon A07HR60]
MIIFHMKLYVPGRRSADKNRWLIAVSAILIHLSIGSIYAYSVYQTPLQALHGWTNSQVTLAFSTGLFVLGLTAASMGWFVEKYGPRRSGLIAAVVFGAGIIGAGASVQIGSLPLFIGTFGVLGGIGLGIGYIAPVSTLVAWFPDKRGLATGMAVMGFGGGALITGPAAQYLMTTLSSPTDPGYVDVLTVDGTELDVFASLASVSQTFYLLGTGYLLAIILGSLYLAKPPKDWAPEGADDAVGEGEEGTAGATSSDIAQLTGRESLRTPRFYLLWFTMYLSISAGLMLLSQAANMTSEITGASAAIAATVVGAIGIFNAGGRIGWASLSDYVGRTNMFTFFLGIQAVALLLMPNINNVWLFSGFLFLIVSCMGGSFACLPAYIADLFGTKEVAVIHGYTLTTWAMAGLISPQLIAYIRDTTGGYSGAMYVIAGALIVGLLIVTGLRLRIRSLQTEAPSGPSAVSTDD